MSGNLIPKGNPSAQTFNLQHLADAMSASFHDDQDELPFDPDQDLSFSPGEEQLYSGRPFVPETLRQQDAAEQEAALDEPGEPTLTLRPIGELDEDMDLLTGPYALSTPPEHRHLATLRLIDDLIVARALLQQLRAGLDNA